MVYQNTRDVEEKSKPGRKRKNEDMDQIIVEMVNEDPELSSKEVRKKLERKRIKLSFRKIKRRLIEAGLEKKMPLFKPLLNSTTD